MAVRILEIHHTGVRVDDDRYPSSRPEPSEARRRGGTFWVVRLA